MIRSSLSVHFLMSMKWMISEMGWILFQMIKYLGFIDEFDGIPNRELED